MYRLKGCIESLIWRFEGFGSVSAYQCVMNSEGGGAGRRDPWPLKAMGPLR
jgi:hypothetical protein